MCLLLFYFYYEVAIRFWSQCGKLIISTSSFSHLIYFSLIQLLLYFLLLVMACLTNNLKCQIFFQHLLQYLCKCLLFFCRLQSCLCPFTFISLFLHTLVSRNFGFVVISNINRSQYTGLFMSIRVFLFLLLIHFLKNNLLHHSLALIQNKSSRFRC